MLRLARALGGKYFPDAAVLIPLFALGVFFCAGHPLHLMNAAQGSTIALIRWLMSHASNQWFSDWYGGLPAASTSSLVFPWVAARLGSWMSWSPLEACGEIAVIIYALIPVAVYVLGRLLVPEHALGVCSSLLVIALSPLCLLVPAIRADTGGLISGWLYAQVFHYSLISQALAFILSAMFLSFCGPFLITDRRWARLLAPVLLTLVAMTDASGMIGIAVVLISKLLTRDPESRTFHWDNAVVAGAISMYFWWCLGSHQDWRLFLSNLRIVDPTVLNRSSFYVYLSLTLAVILFLALFRKMRVPETTRFLFFICLLLGSVVLGREWFKWHLLPESNLLMMEFDVACVILIAHSLVMLFRASPQPVRAALLACFLLYVRFQWSQEKAFLRSSVSVEQIDAGPEYRAAKALERIDPEARVFSPGRLGQTLNSFCDRKQLSGCCNYSVPNAEYRNAISAITDASSDSSMALLWLKAFGVGAVVVTPQTFANPQKFDGALPEIWRDGSTVIYKVSQERYSLAHLVSASETVQYRPENSLDRQVLEPYVAAIESPSAPHVAVQSDGDQRVRIETVVKYAELVSFQVNYSRGWTATVEGKRQPVTPDGLGLMLIHPRCNGTCVIDLRYEPETHRGLLLAGFFPFLAFVALGVPTARQFSTRQEWIPRALAAATLLLLLLCSAWIAEDAFIVFRVIDNALHGYGLRWNVAERVQVYTDPLFMALTTASVFCFGHIYATTVVLSLILTVIAVCLIMRNTSGLTLLLVLAGLLFSKGFIDFSMAGFENPATHLALAGYLFFYWRGKNTLALSLMAAITALNRMDTLLFLLPSLAAVYFRAGWRVWRPAIIGWSPLLLWTAFSVVYYGFVFPNTAYAKLGTGIAFIDLAAQGGSYYANAWNRDIVTLILIALGLITAVVMKQRTIAAGLILNLIYILCVGGDYMGSRFFTPACFVAAALIASNWPFKRTITIASIIAIVAGGMSVPAPTVTSADSGFGEPWPLDDAGIADERAYWNPCTGIWSYFGVGEARSPTYLGRPDNIHYWSCYGPPGIGTQVPGGWPNAKDARTGSLLRTIGHGVYGSSTIGMLGYFAGPKIYIIDDMALADALLARLPVAPALIRIGHFRRDLPQGYLRTIETGQNHLSDPKIATCYADLRLITSGDIWQVNRFAQIAHFAVSRCQTSGFPNSGWLRKK